MMDLDKSGVSTVSTISFLDGPDSTTITTDSAADTEVLFQFLSEATAVNRPHHPQALYMGDSPIHSPPQLHLQGKEDVLELNQELAFFPVTVHDNSPLPLDRTEPRPGPSMVQSSTNTDTVLSPTGASNASSCIFFPPTSSALHQKRRKAKRHAIRTPRPKNCFMIYRSHISPMIMVEYGMLNSTLISRIAGERWQAEPESVRAWYRRVAKKGKEEHERIHPGYNCRKIVVS
ncbi:hypothetical protein BGW38_009094 [Lunasporangiospora selenospora]|uniref:HMG box domain-containing protein n=1 Tax=Lunasporangiospora selenospora TaxID=979761 RepID=A0A9P6FY52_9FUNG|nr:hypothetical protein BGW38_009094 [Lunasporangiospora selenospora]